MDYASPIEHQLAKLREQAQARDHTGRALGGAMAALQRKVKRDARRLAGADEAWNTTCPPHLLDRTAIIGLSRGELRIAVADSATMYELDRCMRSGGEAALARQSAAPIQRVRLTLDARPFSHSEPTS
ncbi:MAG: hypothetical protein KDA20_02035 [Phycisphaerales bacterium]|nr:hypothetical protein [Phycisphaerales bacterium]